eukprot:7554248-Heterocapsa_arctica.AAC.1
MPGCLAAWLPGWLDAFGCDRPGSGGSAGRARGARIFWLEPQSRSAARERPEHSTKTGTRNQLTFIHAWKPH